ncbi:MAG: XRE family transcriptional regulator [Proteobacteria bacterium]|nr:XRE family transcriptional regulator [Pseudomonadota bacterium]
MSRAAAAPLSAPLAGPLAAAALLDRARVGGHLRALRKARGLTLKRLSERSGVALSTLSKMELGEVSVSYEKLAAAARALAVDVAQLFDDRAGAAAGAMAAAGAAAAAPAVVQTRPEDAPRYDSEHYRYHVLASDYPGKRITPLLGTVLARRRDEFPDFIRHAGQEFVIVLSGRLRIEFENGHRIELARHQSAYFDSGIGHVYLSLGRTQARVLVAMA